MLLDSDWKATIKIYKLTEVLNLNEDSFGTVVKAVHRTTKEIVAIKKIKCSFNDLIHMEYVLREITIMR